MPRYVIYCNPPSIASLYDDWSDRPTSFDVITSSEAQQASSAALEDSYDLSLTNDKQDSYTSEDLLLPPPSQLPSADVTAINESSYANDPSAIIHLPDYKFSPEALTPLGQCATLHARAQQSGEPGPKYISVLGFVSLVEPIKQVMQRGKEKKVIEVHLGDETGSMLISAWDAKAVGLASSIRLGDVLYLSGSFPLYLLHITFDHIIQILHSPITHTKNA